MKKELIYTVTCISEYPDNTKDSFVMRICNDLNVAKKLLNDFYEDHENMVFKHGIRFKDVKWSNDQKTKLTATSCLAGYNVVHTYSIHDEYTTNIYSSDPWLER
jgi:hypothetical protein